MEAVVATYQTPLSPSLTWGAPLAMTSLSQSSTQPGEAQPPSLSALHHSLSRTLKVVSILKFYLKCVVKLLMFFCLIRSLNYHYQCWRFWQWKRDINWSCCGHHSYHHSSGVPASGCGHWLLWYVVHNEEKRWRKRRSGEERTGSYLWGASSTSGDCHSSLWEPGLWPGLLSEVASVSSLNDWIILESVTFILRL